MSGLLKALRDIQERATELRKNTVSDFHELTGLFAAGKQLATDAPARSVAEAGRYIAEDVCGAFDSEAGQIFKLIEEAIVLAGGRHE
jgi:hypothetical protein